MKKQAQRSCSGLLHVQNLPPPVRRAQRDILAFGVYLHHNRTTMSRQSISFTEPNNDWLNAKLEAKEYASKSEIVNDLIRRARESALELELIRKKLEWAEKSGFSSESASEILAESYSQHG
jgi:antitoxin ParD1/3/4